MKKITINCRVYLSIYQTGEKRRKKVDEHVENVDVDASHVKNVSNVTVEKNAVHENIVRKPAVQGNVKVIYDKPPLLEP